MNLEVRPAESRRQLVSSTQGRPALAKAQQLHNSIMAPAQDAPLSQLAHRKVNATAAESPAIKVRLSALLALSGSG